MCETKAHYFSCNINTTSRQHIDLVTTYNNHQIKPFTVANILALVVYYVTVNRLKYKEKITNILYIISPPIRAYITKFLEVCLYMSYTSIIYHKIQSSVIIS